MQALSDPAPLLLAGLLACLRFTHWFWRRSSAPFSWRRLLQTAALQLIGGVCCIAGVTALGSLPWFTVIPILCGVILGGRQEPFGTRITCVLCGTLAAFGLAGSWTYLRSLPQYTGPRTQWETPSDKILEISCPANSRGESKKKYPAGFADSGHYGNPIGVPKPFYLNVPFYLWHSSLTGLCAKESRPYRLWFPGGTADACRKGALAVPTDCPPGLEKKLGIWLSTYSSTEEEEMGWND